MNSKETKYFFKIISPKKGTINYLYKLINEFNTSSEEYWEKKDDHDIKLYTKPVYEKSFNHIIIVYHNKLEKIEFIKYLMKKYIDIVDSLEELLKLDENGNKILSSIKRQFEREILDFNKKLPVTNKEIPVTNSSTNNLITNNLITKSLDVITNEEIAFNGITTFNGEQIHDIIERTFNEKIAQYRRTNSVLLIDIPEKELLISIKNKYLILLYEGIVNAKKFIFNILSQLKDIILQKINRIINYVYRKK